MAKIEGLDENTKECTKPCALSSTDVVPEKEFSGFEETALNGFSWLSLQQRLKDKHNDERENDHNKVEDDVQMSFDGCCIFFLIKT